MTWQSASYGVLGSRPSAAALPDAYEYFATDHSGGTLYRVQGGAWVKVAPGAGATTADIPDSSNKRYVTDAELTVLAATSGTNTGDQTVPAFATNAVLLGSAAAAGAAGTVMRSNDTIAAFDATAPTTQAFGDAAAVGTAAFAARRDHKHAMPANPTPILFDSTLGADTASIDTGAAGIATTMNLLEVWIYARTDEAVVFSNLFVTLNNDGSAIYDRQVLRGSNATASAATSLAQTQWTLVAAGASCASGVFAVLRLTCPAYAQTTGNKQFEGALTLADTTAANCRADLVALGYRTTTAISRLAIAPGTGGAKLKAGSRLLIIGR